jgi:hypothetical protein
MDAWWNRHGDIKTGNYSKPEIEDFTGCLPLLLDSSVQDGAIDFESSEEVDIAVRQSQRFVSRMKNELSRPVWSRYAVVQSVVLNI